MTEETNEEACLAEYLGENNWLVKTMSAGAGMTHGGVSQGWVTSLQGVQHQRYLHNHKCLIGQLGWVGKHLHSTDIKH